MGVTNIPGLFSGLLGARPRRPARKTAPPTHRESDPALACLADVVAALTQGVSVPLPGSVPPMRMDIVGVVVERGACLPWSTVTALAHVDGRVGVVADGGVVWGWFTPTPAQGRACLLAMERLIAEK